MQPKQSPFMQEKHSVAGHKHTHKLQYFLNGTWLFAGLRWEVAEFAMFRNLYKEPQRQLWQVK